MVKEGDLLVQIDPAPFQATLNQAIAKLAQDQASLTNAKQDLERTTVLSKQGNATQQLLDQRTANVASLAAQVQADQAAIESAKVQLAYTTITIAADRPRRLSPGRSRQHRARQRSDRHSDDHPAAADLGGLHGARAAAAGHQRSAEDRGR